MSPRPPDLGDVAVPGAADARARSRRVVLAAYTGRGRASRRRRLRAAAPAAAALLAVSVSGAAAATHPVRAWVGDLVAPAAVVAPAAPAAARTPGGGRVLARDAHGMWMLDGGHRRRLGAYDGAAWSPRGLFIVATRGRRLVALQPDGRVRWARTGPGAVADARWSPSGFRIAYREGAELRVIAGDGTGDHLLARRAMAAAPAWRPVRGAEQVAYVDAAGRVVVADADTGRTLARAIAGGHVRDLSWSRSGDRLAAAGATGVWVLSRAGATLWRVRPPAGTTVAHAQLSPGGAQVALVLRAADGARQVVLASRRGSRVVFSALGAIRSVTWSPDGSRVLADWAEAGQWVFLPAARHGHASTAVSALRVEDWHG